MRSAISLIASWTSGATRKPSLDANRAARIMRNGSSPKDTSAGAGVRSTPSARSRNPPHGSTNSPATMSTAMALTVKSRRTRSSSIRSPKATTGLREPDS